MKRYILVTPILCLIGFFIANADEPVSDEEKGSAVEPTPSEIHLLQGTWEGVDSESSSDQKVTITITGNSFHFHRDSNFWFKTTITLPPETDPKQLHATIKDCPPSQSDSIGEVVGAIFNLKGEKLTLIPFAISDEPPKSFSNATSRYVVRKVRRERVTDQRGTVSTEAPSQPKQ